MLMAPQVRAIVMMLGVRDALVERYEQARHDERGVTLEQMILIATFAALAITVGGIVVVKVTTKAKAIPVGS